MQGCFSLYNTQYRYMNLPKNDDKDRTHKNDANTLHLHMVNAYFSTCVSRAIQGFKLVVSKSLRPCVISKSNIVL